MGKLSFEFYRAYKPLLGRLVYRELEYSLDFVEYSVDDLDELSGDGGRTSLTVHTLQIEIEIEIEIGISTGRLLYPWGLIPLMQVVKKPLIEPDGYMGCLLQQALLIYPLKSVVPFTVLSHLSSSFLAILREPVLPLQCAII